MIVNLNMHNTLNNKSYGGGRHQVSLNGEIVYEYLHHCTDASLIDNEQYFQNHQFNFIGYQMATPELTNDYSPTITTFFCKIPLDELVKYLNLKELRELSKLHNISLPHNLTKKTILTYFSNHYCIQCDLYVSVLLTKKKLSQVRTKKEGFIDSDSTAKFPPDPPSESLIETIIRDFCNDTKADKLTEIGCAVCGQLSSLYTMKLLTDIKYNLDVISPGNIGRHERLNENDPIIPLNGPILADNCQHICLTCDFYLKKNIKPPQSLANSFWIGSVPPVLKNLTFAEKMLIARIRHNKCLVRVSSGRAKMTANVIMFSNPTVKVYQVLPPTRKDINEILAFVFQGPARPNDDDIKRTPMLVRRNNVKEALEWLKLNHIDYEDLYISKENLDSYPLAGIPVEINYAKLDPESGNKITTAMSIHDNELEEGTTDGPCPFTVHGLTGPEYENMSLENLKARALQHLVDNGSTLGIGHDTIPQSIYDNPQAYPQMFPWLFPYGHGGIGQKCHFGSISEIGHKKNLLMYHDKRFQTDFYFPMISFNHNQLKSGITGSFLLSKRKKWPSISRRLKTLNRDVLKYISEKLSNGELFNPKSAEEKSCYNLLNDLDHVGGFVQGSITSKKHMRNEIWSMISHLGAPSWFITLSPADSRHPISLYYADENVEFKPDLRSANERSMLTARNPVAAARFFDLMIRMFIKHILGVGTKHLGLYGKTAGYYGTVEQQGRLTLHLHTVLWIRNALSPQEIRDKLMNESGEFQESLIKYLEGCHKGEFLTGTMEEVQSKIPKESTTGNLGIHKILETAPVQSINNTYQDPTQTMPHEPPQKCDHYDNLNCTCYKVLKNWWQKFNRTVDDILLRSNIHKCSSVEGNKSKLKAKGCLNKDGICKARFPRTIVPETIINKQDGYVNIKKLEPMLNTISPCITYLFRCNTDSTSMLSGTTIKAVISYVTDYISKPVLKTHQIFSTAYDVFEKNSNLSDNDPTKTDDARKLILKIVNSLSSKMEIGSPMASLYLLQNPDHYVSHNFVPFWWKSFVSDVQNSDTHNSFTHDEKIKDNHQTFEINQIDSKMDDLPDDNIKTFNHETFETHQDNSIIIDDDKMNVDDHNEDVNVSTDSMSNEYKKMLDG
ncbi:MAG TPA: helitron helicase-like domain-containing protein, partial [Waddliaceae bacterium]